MADDALGVLVLGAGAREHALAWRIAQSPRAARVLVAPGNAGIARSMACAAVDLDDPASVVALARAQAIDLVIIGPERALVAGVADALEAAGVAVIGPTREAARLESSKSFAKALMDEAHIPTAAWRTFDVLEQAQAYAAQAAHPLVIKADGLAAGKGVVITHDAARSLETLAAMMSGALCGEAGRCVVIEECLRGEELSLMALTDGRRVITLPTSRDYKRLSADPRAPNTGGMGAVSPHPRVPQAHVGPLIAQLICPALDALAARGVTYRGFIYAGVMLCADGPRVLEFNARLGDPETQAMMLALSPELDVLDVLWRAAHGRLDEAEVLAPARHAACVVLAAAGYPDAPRVGDIIHGLELARDADTALFYAGVREGAHGLVTGGGRVVSAAAADVSHDRAVRAANLTAERIHFVGMQRRRDIGQ